MPTTDTPEVPDNENPGVSLDDDSTNVPDKVTDKPPAPGTYGDDHYQAHNRSEIPQATTNFDINLVMKCYKHTHISVNRG